MKTKWYNLGFEFCIYTIVFFTPLIFSENFFLSFEIPKIFIFRFFLYIAAIFFVFKVLIEKKLDIPDIFNNKLFKIFLILIPLIFALSTIFSIAPNVSFWGSYYRQEGLFSYIHFFTFFILLLLNFRKEHFERALKVALATFSITLIYGLVQSFGFYVGNFNIDTFLGRNFSSFGHPNFFGSYIIIMFFPLVGLTISSFKRQLGDSDFITFLICNLLIVLSLINLVLNKGRASILGLFIGGFVYLLILGICQAPRPKDQSLRLRPRQSSSQSQSASKKFITLSLIPLILLALLIGSANIFKNTEFIRNNTVLSRFILEGENLRSIETRMIMWPKVAEMAKSHPILGYGPDTFALGYGPFMQKELLLVENFTDIPDRAHNVVLQWLVDFGSTGLCILMAFIVWLFAFAIKKILALQKDLGLKGTSDNILFAISILCSFISIFVAHQFGFSANEHLIFLFFFAAFLFAILSGNSKNYYTKPLSKYFNNKNWSAITAAIILTFFTTTLIPANIFFAYSDQKFSEGYAGVNNGDFFNSLKLLVDAETFYPHTNFYKYMIGSVYLSLADMVNNDDKTKEKALETALDFAQKANVFSSGTDGMNHLLLAKIYSKLASTNPQQQSQSPSTPQPQQQSQSPSTPQPQQQSQPPSTPQPQQQSQSSSTPQPQQQTQSSSTPQPHPQQQPEYHPLAKQEFAAAKELMPLYPNIYLEEGKFYFNMNHLDETTKTKSTPNNNQVTQSDSEKNLQKAIDLFEFYLSLSPPDWQYKEDKNPVNRNKYRLFYKANPTFNEVFNYLAKAYAKTGNNKKSDYYKRFL